MPTYVWECKKCQKVAQVFRSIADMNVSPDIEHDWARVIQAPRVMKVSLADGQRQSSNSKDSANYRDIREAAELEVELVSHPAKSPERKRIDREIKELKTIKRNERN